MKRQILLLLPALLLSACAPFAAPATATPTLTPSPTATFTPAPAATNTPTPAPSLPPEAAAIIERGGSVEDGQVILNGVVWYSLDAASGEWQPAQFVADFAEYRFSLAGLTVETGEDGVVRVIDPNAQEGKQVVYEDGKFLLRYLVRYLKEKLELKPTPYKPSIDARGDLVDNDDVFGYLGPGLKEKRTAAFIKLIGYYPYVQGRSGGQAVMLDPAINAWGLVFLEELQNQDAGQWLCFELAGGEYLIIPLIPTISREDFGREVEELMDSGWEY